MVPNQTSPLPLHLPQFLLRRNSGPRALDLCACVCASSWRLRVPGFSRICSIAPSARQVRVTFPPCPARPAPPNRVQPCPAVPSREQERPGPPLPPNRRQAIALGIWLPFFPVLSPSAMAGDREANSLWVGIEGRQGLGPPGLRIPCAIFQPHAFLR